MQKSKRQILFFDLLVLGMELTPLTILLELDLFGDEFLVLA